MVPHTLTLAPVSANTLFKELFIITCTEKSFFKLELYCNFGFGIVLEALITNKLTLYVNVSSCSSFAVETFFTSLLLQTDGRCPFFEQLVHLLLFPFRSASAQIF